MVMGLSLAAACRRIKPDSQPISDGTAACEMSASMVRARRASSCMRRTSASARVETLLAADPVRRTRRPGCGRRGRRRSRTGGPRAAAHHCRRSGGGRSSRRRRRPRRARRPRGPRRCRAAARTRRSRRMLAVGKPKVRPRFSPWRTSPCTNQRWPRSAFAAAMSPRSSAARTAPDEIEAPPEVTGGTMTQAQPLSRQSASSSAGVPWRPLPKWKS